MASRRHLLDLLILTNLVITVQAGLIEQTWEIKYGFIAPDGVEKVAPLVNGQFPGPTLRGRVGDRVRIRVINKLPVETTSIHWHGIKQTGTPWADGTPGITQCGIGPNDEFVYDFKLEKAGTLWWHSHSGLQKSSLQGLIIIDGDQSQLEPYHDRDIPLMLNDWYHAPRSELISGLKERLPNKFRWVGDAQSILINGRGQYNCSQSKSDCDANHPDAGPAYIDVDEGQTYRMRIFGGTSLSHLNLGIEAHNLTIIEAETTHLRPLSVRYMDVGGGTSYSVMLRTYTRNELDKLYPGHNGLFWIQANVRHRSSGERGLAVLRYSFARSSKLPTRPIPDDWPARYDTAWSLAQARALRSRMPVMVPPATRRIVLLGTQNRHEDGSLIWAMNNVSSSFSSTPLQMCAHQRIDSETSRWVESTTIPLPFNYSKSLSEAGISIYARKAPHVIRLKRNEVVDIILQNTVTLGGKEEVHPWHLHLHDFWVLGYGNHGSWWSPSDERTYNGANAVERNTVVVHPQSWTAIRFVANNPGVALFHCHIASHLELGMALAFQVGEANDIPAPPQGMRTCGLAQ